MVSVLAIAMLAASNVPQEIDDLNARDLAAEVRPGGVDGSPFWNVNSRQFLYAPRFDVRPVENACSYRYCVVDAKGKRHVFRSEAAQSPLTPVWRDVAPGSAVLEVVGLDAEGNAVGRAWRREFHRAEPFAPGSYPPAARSYRECARRGLEWMFRYHPVVSWRTNVFDKTYQLNCFPSKSVCAVVDAALLLSTLDPSRRQELVAYAENAAGWLMATSVREPQSMRGLPLTYADYWKETRALGDVYKSKQIAHRKRNQVMMIYPAEVAASMVALWKATGKKVYMDYARTIADRYLGLQRPDGSWALVLEIGTGRELASNAIGAQGVCDFLRQMSKETGDGRYAEAARRALPSFCERLRTFDWEGQFEDGDVQKKPYANLTQFTASSTIMHLLEAFPDGRYLAAARETLRFCEDQFVAWGTPLRKSWYAPGAVEQYVCLVTIDASYSQMIEFYLRMYELERNPLDLAKARALGDAITRNQMPDGLIPTVFPYDPGRAGRNWLNCMAFTARTLLRLSDFCDEPDAL